MTDKTDNEIIAEFMGFKFAFERGDRIYYVPAGEDLKYKAFKLSHVKFKYDSSWDWLMPVVRKLLILLADNKALDFQLQVDRNIRCGIIERSIWDYLYGRIELSEVHKTIFDNIKWYNSPAE